MSDPFKPKEIVVTFHMQSGDKSAFTVEEDSAKFILDIFWEHKKKFVRFAYSGGVAIIDMEKVNLITSHAPSFANAKLFLETLDQT